ncbi:family 24 glycosyltransferase [Cryphonectria parasitica EP155]|uniref:Family 24 glycosyltransferase n=1 Tax=Cryphonectria parasitica (strain ATCC 38755 / EP155) TaxID=660469 RepID=A0A9P5CN72_CRYP1|nr:family 24 glycosyltransferase [Cryphonectria parasitica EP155]KAF3763610.1 family 24 glycosyltransferase [Cryphonectria parasitica EP155]
MIQVAQLPWGLTASMLGAIVLGGQTVCAGPSVDISMKAAFPSGPYLIELLETAAQENASSYFPLLDRIADGYFAKATTDRELYQEFLDLVKNDGHITSPESLSTFKLALSTRSAAPRLEAHYQYYQTGVEPSLTGDQAGCDIWVLWQGQQYCSPSLDEPRGQVPAGQDRDLPFDIALGSGPGCILYADITAPEFGQFHKLLDQKARSRECAYKLRHRRSSHEPLEALLVSGYGVELALKRTDYIVIDDRKAEEDAAQKAIASEIVLGEEEEVADLKPLSTSELRDLGLKTGSFIMHSDSPFDTLLKLTQDFPKYSTSLATHNISMDFLTEHKANRASLVPGGVNALWMNGVQLVERQMDAFALVDLVRRERKMIHGVMDLGLTGEEAISLLAHNSVNEAKVDDAEVQRFLWHDGPEEGKVIVWLNNIEKDKRYEEFPKTLMTLLQGGMPGQLPSIRRDIFNLVIPVDLTQKNDTTTVVNQLQDFVKRKLPVRFGIVPLSSNEASERQAKVVYHLVETYGLAAMMSYLVSALDNERLGDADKALFDAAILDRKLREDAEALPFEAIFDSEHHTEQIRLSRQWAERLRVDSPEPVLFVNGVPVPRQGNWMPAMGQQVGMDLQLFRQAVFYGEVEEGQWLPEFFLKEAFSRRNTVIFPSNPKELTVLDVNKIFLEHGALFEKVPVIEAYPDSTKENWAVLTVIADLTTTDGLKLAGNALQFRINNPGIRADIVHNPTDPSGAHKINTALKMSQSELRDVDSEDLLRTVLSAWPEVPDDLDYDTALQRFLATAGIGSGQNMLMLNGRLIGPIDVAEDFGPQDFELFFELEQDSRILPVYEAIEELGLTSKVSGPLAAAKVTSITALSTMPDLPEGIFEKGSSLRISAFNVWNSTHTAFEIGDKSTATIQFVAVINPASEQGQRWVPILKVLSELDGVYMQIFLNPKDKLDELPVKRFYRYVLDSAPTFDDAGKVKSLNAEFKGVPSEALLNVGMDVPPAWLVASKVSVHDLDNLKLSSIKSNVEATYELENILIEGHSREPTGAPPRGAQLVLATEKDPHFADTIVMFNIGYFQFKANPGFYNIQLKQGRSSDIYHIESVGAKGYNAVLGDEGTDVVLMDFKGTTLYPRINRKPGMEQEDVLDESGSEGALESVSKSLKGFFGVKTKSVSDEEHAEINIFSVASGHLYERMLNIMMVSVMKNTKHTVKFWFIEQFLSPSFKDFIPYMAEEYGFKYEMVTYKWPHWLRQQKEKQREIWGYKILFLDVLFPLSLDKVIFVDADQIVRTDMYDLVQHDLEGKPYGFTPMCDSRTEMEGFRFWKQGYWANYLRGQPYHISALYVVDLRRFREIAAGDRLRQSYHTLSADPNSLSNLDQDLPNHMQFQLPIHSLPQEWLWCETWCSDEAFKEARTIDLCNNPQTKEPKLDRARRQVPEWTAYDDEIAALDRRRKAKTAETKEEGVSERNTKSRAFEGEDPKTAAPTDVETTERRKDEL